MVEWVPMLCRNCHPGQPHPEDGQIYGKPDSCDGCEYEEIYLDDGQAEYPIEGE